MNYKKYPNAIEQKSRRERKRSRRTVFMGNKALHSKRAKEAQSGDSNKKAQA